MYDVVILRLGEEAVSFWYKSFEKFTSGLSEACCCFQICEKDDLLDPVRIWWCFLGPICKVGKPGMSACSEKKKEAKNVKVDSH